MQVPFKEYQILVTALIFADTKSINKSEISKKLNISRVQVHRVFNKHKKEIEKKC